MPVQNRLIKKIKLPQVFDDCLLMFGQEKDHIPFKIKRIYYITAPTPKLPRGYHAHKKTKQIIFCVQGSIRLILDNGKNRKEVMLNKPNHGVFLDTMVWHEMLGFKKDTILLVLASKEFSEEDYIRDYAYFKKITAKS